MGAAIGGSPGVVEIAGGGQMVAVTPARLGVVEEGAGVLEIERNLLFLFRGRAVFSGELRWTPAKIGTQAWEGMLSGRRGSERGA